MNPTYRRLVDHRDRREAGGSIKYQLTIATLPLAQDLDDFQFEGTPIDERLLRNVVARRFRAQQRKSPASPMVVRESSCSLAETRLKAEF
jgi:hypothetical protein